METKKLRMRAWYLIYKHKIISKYIDLSLAISRNLLSINEKTAKKLEVIVEKLKKG